MTREEFAELLSADKKVLRTKLMDMDVESSQRWPWMQSNFGIKCMMTQSRKSWIWSRD